METVAINRNTLVATVLAASMVFPQGFCLAQSSQELDAIVIRRPKQTRWFCRPLLETAPTEVISAGQIDDGHYASASGALAYVPGVDMQTRTPGGIQSDLSVRGSTSEQAQVRVDGIPLADPQTSHHNLNIPLPTDDIERIEVLKKPLSAAYGPGAAAGGINIVTKRPAKSGGKVAGFFGQHALSGQSASLYDVQKDSLVQWSGYHSASNGARPNTDFAYLIHSFQAVRMVGTHEFSARIGYQKKDFGADSFYSNLYREEEEHTATFMGYGSVESPLEWGVSRQSVFIRRNRDQFILNRNNPVYTNTHTSYAAGGVSAVTIETSVTPVYINADVTSDRIGSSNLGDHERLYGGCSVGVAPYFGEKLLMNAFNRIDYLSAGRIHDSWCTGVSYVLNPALKSRYSFATGVRMPSFTELYYNDPANKGNASLSMERSYMHTGGIEYAQGHYSILVEIFQRRVTRMIDWIRRAEQEPWEIMNTGNADFRGCEITTRLAPGKSGLAALFRNLEIGYQFMDVCKNHPDYASKYALDVVRHRWQAALEHSLFGYSLNWQASYTRRRYGEVYCIGRFTFSRKIALNSGRVSLKPFVSIDNFTNAHYSEVAGVIQPGRWIRSGVQFEW